MKFNLDELDFDYPSGITPEIADSISRGDAKAVYQLINDYQAKPPAEQKERESVRVLYLANIIAACAGHIDLAQKLFNAAEWTGLRWDYEAGEVVTIEGSGIVVCPITQAPIVMRNSALDDFVLEETGSPLATLVYFEPPSGLDLEMSIINSAGIYEKPGLGDLHLIAQILEDAENLDSVKPELYTADETGKRLKLASNNENWWSDIDEDLIILRFQDTVEAPMVSYEWDDAFHPQPRLWAKKYEKTQKEMLNRCLEVGVLFSEDYDETIADILAR